MPDGNQQGVPVDLQPPAATAAGRDDCSVYTCFFLFFLGLWFDLEISYSGSFLMTLETKMNLARLGKEGEGLGEHGKEW